MKKEFFLLAFMAILVFLAGLIAKPLSAADSPGNYSAEVQQKIKSLMQQIIALLKQVLGLRLAQTAQIKNQGVLTVNASGVAAYVSINGGESFPYASPVQLNEGDSYKVTAGNTTCSGTASANGTYVCNISVSQ